MFWFTLFMFVASFLLTILLAPKPELEDARPSRLGDIRFPRASAGSPVPLIYGKVRLRSPNTLWYGAFKAIANTKKVKTGFFSSERVITGYDYALSMDLGLCTGPNVSLHKIFVEKKVVWSGNLTSGDAGSLTTINKPGLFGGSGRGGGLKGNIRFYGGSFTQSKNSYLQTGFPGLGTKIPAYVGISHIVFEDVTFTFKFPKMDPVIIHIPFWIGSSPQLRPMSFEISRYSDGLSLGANQKIGDDLNPMEVLYSALTEDWGGLNMDPADIETADLVAVATTLVTEGNGMSLIIERNNTAKTIIEEVLRQIDGMMYQDPQTGKMRIRLIREDYVIGNLPVLDKSNVKSVRNFSRTSWAETYNQVRVVYNSRARNYEEGAALIQDMANMEIQNRIKSMSVSIPGIHTETTAVQVGSRVLSQRNVPLFSAQIEAHREIQQLVPGDAFVFSWDDFNIVQTVMRVQRFDAGELINGKIVIDVIQDSFASSQTLYGSPEDTSWVPQDRTAVDIVEFELLESPAYFVDKIDPADFTFQVNTSYFWGFARRPTFMERYSLVTSDDVFVGDEVYELNDVDFPYSFKLNEALIAEQGQKNGFISKIVVYDTDPGSNIFGTTTKANITADGVGMFYMNGEWFAYEGVNDLGGGIYELTNVYRALLDSQFIDHPVNTVGYLVHGSEPLSRAGRADIDIISYQFLSSSDEDQQQVGDPPTNSITTNQRYNRPAPPDYVDIEGVRCPIEIIGVTNINLTWRERNRKEGTIAFVDDASDTPETSTTYNTRLFLDGVQLDSSTGLAVTNDNLIGLSSRGTLRVEVESVVGGLISRIADFDECFYANYQNLSAELVSNPGFESGLTSWTTVTGSWASVSTVYPLDPVITVGATTDIKHLESSGTTNQITQDIDVLAHQGKAGLFRVWKGGKSSATGQVRIQLLNVGLTVLQDIQTPLVAASNIGSWELVEIPVSISTTSKWLRITVDAPAADSVWDNMSVKANTLSQTTATKYDTITGLTVNGAWGLRKMHSTYLGNLVRIRDTFDNTEQDVGFDEDGNLAPFYVRGEARVVKLYDQSGNLAHLEQTLQSDQPRLMWMLSETGRPYIDFENTEQLLDQTVSTTRPYMVTRPNMCIAMTHTTSTSGDSYIAIIQDNESFTSPFFRWGLNANGANWQYAVNATRTNEPGAQAPSVGNNVWFMDYQNGELYHNDDAISTKTFTAADITYPNNTRLRVGKNNSTGTEFPWDGEFYELCIFSGSIAALDRKTIMEAVALYWSNMVV